MSEPLIILDSRTRRGQADDDDEQKERCAKTRNSKATSSFPVYNSIHRISSISVWEFRSNLELLHLFDEPDHAREELISIAPRMDGFFFFP